MISAENLPEIRRKTSLRTWGQNLLLFGLSLGLALAIVEGVLRIYNPMGFRLKGNRIILPVNTKEIRHFAGAQKLDESVTVTRNSLGFRGEEPPADFKQWLTLITLGGSTTECLDLADDKTWPQVLGVKLKHSFRPLWLNNAGITGHSTYGHVVLMENFIIKIKPQAIIFLIGLNDLGLEDLRSEDRNINPRSGFSAFRSLEKFLEAGSDYSEVAALLLNLKRYFFPKIEMMIVNQEKDLAGLPRLEMAPDAKSSLTRLYQEKYLGLYDRRVRNLVRLCRENGIVPIFMTQPALYGNAVDALTGVNLAKIQATKQMNGEVAWQILELYNQVTRQVGKEAGVPVIDLARKLPKDSRYFYDLTHFTNEGAEKVAEIAAADLRPFLAAKFPQYQVGPGSPSPEEPSSARRSPESN